MTGTRRSFVVVATCVLLLHIGMLWALRHGLPGRTPAPAADLPLLARIVPTPQTAAPPSPPSTRLERIATASALPDRKPQAHLSAPKPPLQRTQQETQAVPIGQPARQPAVNTEEPARQAPMKTPVSPGEPPPAPMLAVAAQGTGSAPPSRPGVVADTGADKAQSQWGTTSALTGGAAGIATAAAPSAPVPFALELPSSDAQYLQNPEPSYPPISRQLREQGTVMVDVLVSDKGLAQEARVKTSSGFFRLDNAAVSTVRTWRFVPGKRGGIAQPMWFTVPITFRIQ